MKIIFEMNFFIYYKFFNYFLKMSKIFYYLNCNLYIKIVINKMILLLFNYYFHKKRFFNRNYDFIYKELENFVYIKIFCICILEKKIYNDKKMRKSRVVTMSASKPSTISRNG